MNSKCKASENISRLYSGSDSEDGDKTKKGEYKSSMQISAIVAPLSLLNSFMLMLPNSLGRQQGPYVFWASGRVGSFWLLLLTVSWFSTILTLYVIAMAVCHGIEKKDNCCFHVSQLWVYISILNLFQNKSQNCESHYFIFLILTTKYKCRTARYKLAILRRNVRILIIKNLHLANLFFSEF